MKQPGDNKTIDMLGPPKRLRGRPPGDKPALTSAQRVAAARARAREAGRGSLTITLPLDMIAALDEYIKFKDTNKDAVIERLVKAQLLRKR